MCGPFFVSGLGAMLAGALLLGASEALTHCPTRCTCADYGDQITMYCDIQSMNITVDVIPGSEIKITCDYFSENRLLIEDLQQMDYLGQNESMRLILDSCRLPPSFALAGSRLGATFEQLYILFALEKADLTSDMVKGLERLERLAIYSNKLKETVPSKAFAKLPSLKKFTLSNGRVTLQAGDFDSAPNLDYLELSLCNISNLPNNIFRKLTRLKTLVLFKNSLKDLSEEQLKGLESLKILDVTDGELNTRSLMSLTAITRALGVLRASANSFEELPPLHDLHELKEVSIHDNTVPLKIASKALAYMPALEKVDLARSRIESLPADFLEGSSSLETLLLQGNLLTQLPDDLFKDQASLETLDLSGNKLTHLSSHVLLPLQALKHLNHDFGQKLELGTYK